MFAVMMGVRRGVSGGWSTISVAWLGRTEVWGRFCCCNCEGECEAGVHAFVSVDVYKGGSLGGEATVDA